MQSTRGKNQKATKYKNEGGTRDENLSTNVAMNNLCIPTRRRKLPFILTNVGDGRRSKVEKPNSKQT